MCRHEGCDLDKSHFKGKKAAGRTLKRDINLCEQSKERQIGVRGLATSVILQ